MSLFKRTNKETVPVTQYEPRDWKLISINYAGPRKDVVNMSFADQETERMALFGVTTYVFQDTNSGEIKRELVLGSNRQTLDELVQKVEAYGPQHFRSELNNKIYTIKPYIEPNPNPAELPVKYDTNTPTTISPGLTYPGLNQGQR